MDSFLGASSIYMKHLAKVKANFNYTTSFPVDSHIGLCKLNQISIFMFSWIMHQAVFLMVHISMCIFSSLDCFHAAATVSKK